MGQIQQGQPILPTIHKKSFTGESYQDLPKKIDLLNKYISATNINPDLSFKSYLQLNKVDRNWLINDAPKSIADLPPDASLSDIKDAINILNKHLFHRRGHSLEQKINVLNDFILRSGDLTLGDYLQAEDIPQDKFLQGMPAPYDTDTSIFSKGRADAITLVAKLNIIRLGQLAKFSETAPNDITGTDIMSAWRQPVGKTAGQSAPAAGTTSQTTPVVTAPAAPPSTSFNITATPQKEDWFGGTKRKLVTRKGIFSISAGPQPIKSGGATHAPAPSPKPTIRGTPPPAPKPTTGGGTAPINTSPIKTSPLSRGTIQAGSALPQQGPSILPATPPVIIPVISPLYDPYAGQGSGGGGGGGDTSGGSDAGAPPIYYDVNGNIIPSLFDQYGNAIDFTQGFNPEPVYDDTGVFWDISGGVYDQDGNTIVAPFEQTFSVAGNYYNSIGSWLKRVTNPNGLKRDVANANKAAIQAGKDISKAVHDVGKDMKKITLQGALHDINRIDPVMMGVRGIVQVMLEKNIFGSSTQMGLEKDANSAHWQSMLTVWDDLGGKDTLFIKYVNSGRDKKKFMAEGDVSNTPSAADIVTGSSDSSSPDDATNGGIDPTQITQALQDANKTLSAAQTAGTGGKGFTKADKAAALAGVNAVAGTISVATSGAGAAVAEPAAGAMSALIALIPTTSGGGPLTPQQTQALNSLSEQCASGQIPAGFNAQTWGQVCSEVTAANASQATAAGGNGILATIEKDKTPLMIIGALVAVGLIVVAVKSK